MTHQLLRFAARFAKRTPQLVRQEIRIVTKPVVSSSLQSNRSLHLSPAHELGMSVCVRRGTNIRGRTIRMSRKRLQQQAVVLVVERLTRQIRPSTPALATHAGPTVESANREP